MDFLRLVDDDLAGWFEVSSLRLEPAEEFLDQPTGAERTSTWTRTSSPSNDFAPPTSRACFAKIAEADELTEVGRFLLFNCVATYLELDGGAAAEYVALRDRYRKPEVEMKPITWEEKVEARGLEKGREQGKESGMREVLLRLLRSRFPSLPGQTIARVEAIRTPEELGSLAERLLTARSLEELGLA